MPVRSGPAALAAALFAAPLAAQPPAAGLPPPKELPPTVAALGQSGVRLPRDEQWQALDPGTVRVQRVNGSWQVYANGAPFRDFGDSPDNAADAARVLRELHATQWTAIGTGRAVVEYGLSDGQVAPNAGFPRQILPIDLRTARAEAVRGAWCLRDNANILLNFGPHKPDAEQALAVCRKYGFNRIGMVGRPTPALTYFFAQPDAAAPPATGAVPAALQEQALTRTGIEVPGLGYVGEKVAIDPRKAVARREKGEWVVAAGPEVIARFGPSEWSARDAAKVIQDGRFSEVCRFGTAGVTFFLVGGQAPTKVPFFAQGARFDPNGLRVREMAGKWWVYDGGGRQLLPAGSAEEAGQLVKLIKAYGFDQLCQVGTSPQAALKFLAKGR